MVQEYTIKETLEELNISKATLYYRINKFRQKLENHISERNGKKYISVEGLEILKINERLDNSLNSLDESLDRSGYDEEPDDSVNVCEILRKENEFLKSQLLEKDRQITTKDEHISSMTKLIENSQILLKLEKDKVLMLEAQNKKSWWEKLFKS